MWNNATSVNIDVLKNSILPVLIIKHSTRCSISSIALNRLLENQVELDLKFEVVLIDVIRNRSTSLDIADRLHVSHESPQVILIKNSEVIYTASHLGIRANELLQLS